MHLSPLARLRGRLSAVAARSILSTPALVRALARRRSAPREGRTLDPELAAMLRLDDLSGNSRIESRTPARARAQLAEDCAGAQLAVSDPVEAAELTLGGPAGPLPARLYAPAGLAAGSPGIVFFHGGGFVTGDLDSHDPLCRVLAARGGVRVIAIDYRLAPEHPFPAAVDDCVAAFRAVVGRAAELGVDARRLALAGDSAGGNLSAVVALHTRSDAIPPALQVLLYPALDATCREPSHRSLADGYFLTAAGIEWYYRHTFGADAAARRHPDASPLLAETVAGVAPARIYAAGFDPLRDEALRYGERLSASAVPVTVEVLDPMIHGFLLMTAYSRAAAAATDRIAREVGDALRAGR